MSSGMDITNSRVYNARNAIPCTQTAWLACVVDPKNQLYIKNTFNIDVVLCNMDSENGHPVYGDSSLRLSLAYSGLKSTKAIVSTINLWQANKNNFAIIAFMPTRAKSDCMTTFQNVVFMNNDESISMNFLKNTTDICVSDSKPTVVRHMYDDTHTGPTWIMGILIGFGILFSINLGLLELLRRLTLRARVK